VKYTTVIQICKANEHFSFQQQHLCTASFTQEPYEVQPGEVQIPAPGEEKPWAPVHVGGHPEQSSLAGKDLGSQQ